MNNIHHASEHFSQSRTFIFRVEFYPACFYSSFNQCGCTILSRKTRNKMQRAKNGNGVPETICFQNIPGKCGPDRVGDIITDILDKYRPVVLFVAEARADVVASKTPHGYNHYPGTLK